MLKLQLNYFGGAIIKKQLKGYIKNITENEQTKINTTAIKTTEELKFLLDNTQNKLQIKKDKTIFVRKDPEKEMTFTFCKDTKTEIKIKLLENGLYVKVPIKTTNIEITENNINIFYTIIDNNIEYELKIQLEDELWV